MAYKNRQRSGGWLQNRIALAGVTVLLGILARAGCVPQELEKVGQIAQAVDGNLPGLINQHLLGGANRANGSVPFGQGPAASGNGSYSGLPVQPGGYQLPNFGAAQTVSGSGQNSPGILPAGTRNPEPLSAADQRGIVVGSYNIQKLGRSKLSSPDVTAILLDIIAKYDVLAIQELVSTEQNLIPWMVEQLNLQGHSYSWIVGPRQGYTTYQEQYVFLFNTRRIRVLGQPFVAQDPGDRMHRSPLVAHFQCTEPGPAEGFSFALVNVHTDPDVVLEEFSRLELILPKVREYLAGEDDVIVLGDLNAWPSVFAPYRLLPNQFALIPDNVTTNTRRNRNYDNLVLDSASTSEFTGQRGVLDVQNHYRLTPEQALDVSDHFPVWGQFRIREERPMTAAAGGLQTGFTVSGR